MAFVKASVLQFSAGNDPAESQPGGADEKALKAKNGENSTCFKHFADMPHGWVTRPEANNAAVSSRVRRSSSHALLDSVQQRKAQDEALGAGLEFAKKWLVNLYLVARYSYQHGWLAGERVLLPAWLAAQAFRRCSQAQGVTACNLLV